MEVILAENAGFCWGVDRAIKIASDLAEKGQKVYTDGPLIHNRQMVDKLGGLGISEVGDYQNSAEIDIPEKQNASNTVLVRAHGISPERRTYLKGLKADFKDATCPDVGIIAGKVRLHTKKGYNTVIFGDPTHPEVIGLLGYTEGRGHVIESAEDILQLPENLEPVCMVSQSTMFTEDFQKLSECLKRRFKEALVFDTICGATKDRQGDIEKFTEMGVEAVVVIGGRHSANTKKLTLLTERLGLPAYHIETVKELDTEHLKKRYSKVGVTAGASTPEFIIREVVNRLNIL